MAAVRLGSYKNTRREAMTVGTAATRIRSSVTTIGLAHTLHDLTLYGILDGEILAAYGWYARTPTRIDPPDLVLHPGNEYVYMYKGYTHTGHRGRRLHAIGMTLALQEYLARGFKGLVSYVESNNFSSLNSVTRMGYEIFGTVYALEMFGIHLVHASAGWAAHGVRVERG